MTTNRTLITRSNIGRVIRCNAHAGRAAWIKNDRPQALAMAMLREDDFQPARIPFDGFYNSFLTAAFDEGVAHSLEWWLEEAESGNCSLTRDELEDRAGDCCISSADAVEIARSWVDRYEDFLTDAANDLADEADQQDQICLRFASYNAEANSRGYWAWGDEERPVAYISKADLRRLRRLAAQARGSGSGSGRLLRGHLRNLRLRRVRPQALHACKRLGPVTAWNAAQIGVLLDFICPDRRLTEYGLGDRLTEEIDTLASAALSKRITAYCCEDAA